MSVVDLISSMQQIQSRIASFTVATPALGSAPLTSADSAASSAAFDQLVASMASGTDSTDALDGADPTVSAPSTSGVSGAGAAGALGAAAGAGATGADVVADARKYLGVPYVLGGESSTAMDCSGLVQKTYRDLGVSVSRLVHTQKLEGTAVPSLAQAQPGDLIVFKGGKHVAIYAGNNTVIHAPYPGRTVSEQKLWVGDAGIETIRRILPSGGAS